MYVIEIVKDKTTAKLRVINLQNFNLIYDTVICYKDSKSFGVVEMTENINNGQYVARLYDDKNEAVKSCDSIANEISEMDKYITKDKILKAIRDKSNVIPESLEEMEGYDEEVYDKTLVGSN